MDHKFVMQHVFDLLKIKNTLSSTVITKQYYTDLWSHSTVYKDIYTLISRLFFF